MPNRKIDLTFKSDVRTDQQGCVKYYVRDMLYAKHAAITNSRLTLKKMPFLLPFSKSISVRMERLGPGTKGFLHSLGVVSLCFAGSKVFSSIATIVMARFLGSHIFGEASVILLVAQVACPVMLLGLHMSIMRYGANQENPTPWIATAFYIASLVTILVSGLIWICRSPLAAWLDVSYVEIGWAVTLAVAMSAYLLFTHFFQTLNLYKARGLIEVLMGFALLPGLAFGFWLFGKSYEMALMAYLAAFLLCLPPMIYRFRNALSPTHLFAPNTGEMIKYGSFACFGGIGFILTFVVQPLQMNHYLDEEHVGMFRLYSASSISLATFATSIFYTVFFPKAAASSNRAEIWRVLTLAWLKAAFPLMSMYAAVFAISVSLSGDGYPLTWTHTFLFSAASMLITVQTTYGQLIAAQGISGMRWMLAIGIGTGVFNILLSMWLIPTLGITGAVLTLVATFTIALISMMILKKWLSGFSD